MNKFLKFAQKWIRNEGVSIAKGLYQSASPKLWRAWGFGFLILLIISFYKASDEATFFGIAESREIPFNFDRPVVLTRVLVSQGLKVKKGDLLAEVDQPELNAKIVSVKAQIEDIKTKGDLLKSLEKQKASQKQNPVGKSEDALTLRKEALEQELSVYQKQKEELLLFAPENGTIGQVLFKVGENIPAFASIMNMVPDWPTSVRGYLIENFQYEPIVGQSVSVRSLANNGKVFIAKIISVGDRIVPFPERLKMRPDFSVFGREILITLPAPNNFLIGEKVFIEKHEDYVGRAFASIKNAFGRKASGLSSSSINEIDVPSSIKRLFHLEASGAVFLPDLAKYLIASDDTGSNQAPYLLSMTQEGSIERTPIAVEGLQSFSDIESLSVDKEGRLYALSSCQKDKEGENRLDRNLLIRMIRNRNSLKMDRTVNLAANLKKLLKISDKDINLEGHFISGDTLYVAIREPLVEKHSQIFSIKPLSRLMQKGLSEDPDVSDLEITLWNEFKFPEINGEKQGISDLLLVGNQILLLSSCLKGESCGALWIFQLNEAGKGKLNALATYKENKPEGLAYDSIRKELAIFFDEGRRKESRWTKVPWEPSP